ncbi:hypothetical protein [Peterkaempfera sp. SMS 1(5)a]|uniref:hypothetical protein n=1 Tax=Peterkaempfera podocarpi TaxID=3232308 RepID=UPI003672C3E9
MLSRRCVRDSCWRLPKVWRGDERTVQKMVLGFTAWPVSSETRRGMVRGALPLTASGFFVGTTVLSGLVLGGQSSDSSGAGTVAAVCFLVSLAALVLSVGLHLGIILFNRPRLLVPPSMRGDRGVWQRG